MLTFAEFLKLKNEGIIPNVGVDNWRAMAQKNPEINKYVNVNGAPSTTVATNAPNANAISNAIPNVGMNKWRAMAQKNPEINKYVNTNGAPYTTGATNRANPWNS